MSQIIATTLSNGSVSVPTATVVNGSAKAWVNFNGSGTVAIRDSFNVSGLSDNGTGDYTISYTNSMAGADNYSVTGCAGENTTSMRAICQNRNLAAPLAGSVRVQSIRGDGDIQDCSTGYTAIHGDLA